MAYADFPRIEFKKTTNFKELSYADWNYKIFLIFYRMVVRKKEGISLIHKHKPVNHYGMHRIILYCMVSVDIFRTYLKPEYQKTGK